MATIETDRLILQPLTEKDAPVAFLWESDPEVNRFMSYPLYQRVEDTAEWISSIGEEDHVFGIFLKSGELIGACSVERHKGAEEWGVGYNLRREAWGKGYATEAVRAMIAWANGLYGAKVFTATYALENTRSERVLEKCGFVADGDCEYSKTDKSATFQARRMKLIL